MAQKKDVRCHMQLKQREINENKKTEKTLPHLLSDLTASEAPAAQSACRCHCDLQTFFVVGLICVVMVMSRRALVSSSFDHNSEIQYTA